MPYNTSEKRRQYQWKRNLRRRYQMTPEEYYILFEKQHGACWLCGYKPDSSHRGLHVDHNHKTGKVRGLLCRACNKDVIGAVEKIGLQKIIDYLY